MNKVILQDTAKNQYRQTQINESHKQTPNRESSCEIDCANNHMKFAMNDLWLQHIKGVIRVPHIHS